MSTSKDKPPLKSSFSDIENDQQGAEKQTKLSGYKQSENEAPEIQLNDDKNTICSDTWICSQDVEDSPWQQSNLGEYKQRGMRGGLRLAVRRRVVPPLSLWKSTPTLKQSSNITSQKYQFTQILETISPEKESLTSSQWDFPALERATREVEQDYLTQPPLFGEKDLDVLWSLNPASVLLNNSHGVIRRGLRTILATLYLAGYSFEIETVSARELGAGHQRFRLFIISYPDEQRGIYEQTCWSDQMREMVQRQRANQEWLTVRNEGDRSDDGFSVGLVRGSERTILEESDYTEPSKTPGRIRARYLAGRTVTPAQAAVALERVLYLNSITGG